MGNRICLRFTDGHETSPTLYAHWTGEALLGYARRFWNEYKERIRSEPSNWLVNFLVWFKDSPEDGGLYLYQNDNVATPPDDNGYWEFNTVTGVATKIAMGGFDHGTPVGTEYRGYEE